MTYKGVDMSYSDVPIQEGVWKKCYSSGVVVDSGVVSSCCDMWNDRETPYCPYCGLKMHSSYSDTSLEVYVDDV